MIHQILKNEKEYTVPGKYITWTIGRNTLDLKVNLDRIKYENGGLSLPPIEFGLCKDWHFELSNNISSVTFIAKWPIRRIKYKLQLIDTINKNITKYALNLK